MKREKMATDIRQEQIAAAALELVARQGLPALSMANIARKVGVVPSAIYRHFQSKDEVIRAMLAMIETRMRANVEAALAEAEEPLDALKRLLTLHAHLIRDNVGIPRLLFSEEVYGSDARHRARSHEMVQAFLSRVRELFSRSQQRGEIRRDIKAESLAVMYLGLIQTPAILWHLSGGQFDIARHVQKAWRVFTDALVPAAKRKKTREENPK